MILIASSDNVQALKWHQMLAQFFQVYEIDVNDRRTLDLCLKKAPIELLLVDVDLLGEGGVHELSSLKELQPEMHIIMMTKEPKEREEISAILFGAQAYCSFDISQETLPKVIRTVLSNELWVDRKFISRLLSEIEDITQSRQVEVKQIDRGIARLSPRECQIAKLVATGGSNRKIAEQLNISERTVKAHLGVIFRKMGIRDRLQLALYMNKHQQLSDVWHSKRKS